jgi:hypothetical protein
MRLESFKFKASSTTMDLTALRIKNPMITDDPKLTVHILLVLRVTVRKTPSKLLFGIGRP